LHNFCQIRVSFFWPGKHLLPVSNGRPLTRITKKHSVLQLETMDKKYEPNQIFKRATPVQRKAYSNAKLAILLHNCVNGLPLLTQRRNSAVKNDRLPEHVIYMESSRLRIGKNSFLNRQRCMHFVKFKWSKGIIVKWSAQMKQLLSLKITLLLTTTHFTIYHISIGNRKKRRIDLTLSSNIYDRIDDYVLRQNLKKTFYQH